MDKIYKHTQIGYLVIYLFGIPLIAILITAFLTKTNLSLMLSFFIVALCLLILFYSLTVEIANDYLKFYFGIGLIKFKINIEEIYSCEIVKNPWYYGWGIRLTPNGWLYNISGFQALEINLKNGKRFRLGTDEAEELRKTLYQKNPSIILK